MYSYYKLLYFSMSIDSADVIDMDIQDNPDDYDHLYVIWPKIPII